MKNLPARPPAVKTQKAKGILALAKHGVGGHLSTAAVSQITVYPHQPRPAFPFFARPCPRVPRHGFVDSRMVHDEAGWDRLLEEIEGSGEPEVEVICMPYLEARWSGILTPAGVTIGPGNDGATSGHDARSVPAPAALDAFLQAFHLKKAMADAAVTQNPFLEMVATAKAIEAVQLRDGPAVGMGHAYVPDTMDVTEVLEAGGDLLAWEELMKQYDGKKGVVVWHPGGALSSHYGVQAIVHGLAVLCDGEKPQIGHTLAKTGNGPRPLTEKDYDTLRRLLATACRTEIPELTGTPGMINLAIAALHAQALWGPERHLLLLRAVGLAYMVRFSVAAILGELRHWDGAGPGRKGVTRLTDVGTFRKSKKKGVDRQQVHEQAFGRKILHLTGKLETAVVDFSQPGWSASFGGKNWAHCAQVVLTLYGAIGAFLKDPSKDTWLSVLAQWNHTVNVFHNNGAMLNKFITKSLMDTFAVVPSFGLVNNLVGKLVLSAHEYAEHKIPTKVGKHLTAKGTLPAAPPKPAWPEAFEGRLVVHDRVLCTQVKLPESLNKPYGAGFPLADVSETFRTYLTAKPHDSTSLTGSATKTWTCTYKIEPLENGTKGLVLYLDHHRLAIPHNGIVQRILMEATHGG